MRRIHILLTFLFALQIHGLSAGNDVWTVTAEIENFGALRFYMLSEKDSCRLLKSLPDRDNLILGKTKATLFRWMQKRENKNSMVVIELKNNGKMDFSALQMTLRNVGFQSKDTVTGAIFDRRSKKRIGRLLAVRTSLQAKALSPIANYVQIVDALIKTTANKIYDPALVRTKKWQSFAGTLRSKSHQIYDDVEFLLLFYAHVNQTGFSHYALLKTEVDLGKTLSEPQIDAKIVEDSIVYLKFKSLAGRTEEIDSVFQRYVSYPVYVIDLRDTPGGKLDAAYRLASYLANRKCDAGVFVGRKYDEDRIFSGNRNNVESLQAQDFSNFGAILEAKQAVKISFEPRQPLPAQIHILINRKTAGACEVLVQGLKGRGNIRIFGERTAGSMLFPSVYTIGSHFYLIVPTAGYLTPAGKSIEGHGVQPDVKKDYRLIP
jgi:hypothetical protein